jgi:REP element-mobilizing transposase RayT
MFVTFCCRPRIPLLGRVTEDAVDLSPSGEIVAADLRALPSRRPGVAVDVFQVMPDHVHAIVVLGGGVALGAVVGSLKSGTAAAINRLRGTPGGRVWQRGYYDHVVRDDADLDRIREYIVTNPSTWTANHRP